jgi:RNA polymerase sigma factor (sigma-70 family)
MAATHNTPSGPLDLALITQYKNTQDIRLVGELFERHAHLILAIAKKYFEDQEDAKDAASDIFEELVTKLLNHDVTNFKSWLYSVVRNHCLMKLRKSKGITEVDVDDKKFENVFMESPSFEHLNDGTQSETEIIHNAIAQLKDHQRVCVEMFFLQELSYKEVSERTGFELSQVKSYIQNGKRNLQLILSKTF